MQFNDNDLKEIWLTVVTNVDPASATLNLAVDDVEYPCGWDGAAVQEPAGTWTRHAHTAGLFAGPNVAAGEIGSAVVLMAGRHDTEVRLRLGGRIIADRSWITVE